MEREQAMKYLQSEKERFEAIKKSSEERLCKAPEGTVYINKHRNGIQFYFRSSPEDKRGRYLHVAEQEKAFALVRTAVREDKARRKAEKRARRRAAHAENRK